MDYCVLLFPSLLKVETIGDAYMVVEGTKEGIGSQKHGVDIVNFAILVQHAVSTVLSPLDGSPIRLRVGIHTGSCLGGVVGDLMPRWCLFGLTINIAARMEQCGEPNCINVSEPTASLLLDAGLHVLRERGVVMLKGVGKMQTYFVKGATSQNTRANLEAVAQVNKGVRKLKKIPIMITSKSDTSDASLSNISTSTSTSASKLSSKSNNKGVLDDFESTNSISVSGYNLRRAQALSIYLEKHLTVMAPPRPLARTRSSTSACGGGGGGDGFFIEEEEEDAKMEAPPPKVVHALLIEDSIVQSKMITRTILEAAKVLDENWIIELARDGETAIEMVQKSPHFFDVIFVDQILSENGLSGNDVLEILRGVNYLNDMFIIGVVSNINNARVMFQGGANLVWSKPVPSGEVIAERLFAAGRGSRIFFPSPSKASRYGSSDSIEEQQKDDSLCQLLRTKRSTQRPHDASAFSPFTPKFSDMIDETAINLDVDLIRGLARAQQSFVVTDPSLPDNPITYASDGFCVLSGYSRREVLGRNCRYVSLSLLFYWAFIFILHAFPSQFSNHTLYTYTHTHLSFIQVSARTGHRHETSGVNPVSS